MSGKSVNSLGVWAAAGAGVASLAYGVPQIMQVLGLLPMPLDRILIFAPSLALAPLFVVALAAGAAQASSQARPWRAAALAVAILYAGLVSLVYIVQLGVVIPREIAGQAHAVAIFACCGFRAPMTAIDLLGYTYMALAMLLLLPTVQSPALRWLLLANGLLAPVILLQIIWPSLIYAAAIWLAVFPAAMLLLAREFTRSRTA